MEDQAQLFDLFKRARSAEESDQKGWGLGLTLVRGMVESHGGKISVKSLADLGTTFTARLPLDSRSKWDQI